MCGSMFSWIVGPTYKPTQTPLQKLIASAFGNGEQGVMYVPKPVVLGNQALYQDAVGTTPVTADGDPVGLMLDVSGNGNHATQTTSASRPIYRTDGTLHWLECDGVDDWLDTPLATSVDTVSLRASGFSVTPTSGSIGQIHADRANVVYGRYATGIGIDPVSVQFMRANGPDPTVVQTGIPLGSPVALQTNEEYLTGGLGDARINGSNYQYSVERSIWSENMSLFSGRGLTAFFSGKFFGGFIVLNRDTPPSSDVEDYLAKLAGITL